MLDELSGRQLCLLIFEHLPLANKRLPMTPQIGVIPKLYPDNVASRNGVTMLHCAENSNTVRRASIMHQRSHRSGCC